jgi:hypothetical protein
MTPNAARKLAEIRWGKPQDVFLAISRDRKTTLAIGWFSRGPRGGLRPLYAVRLGTDAQGCALGGCCLFGTDEAHKALECFERYASSQSEASAESPQNLHKYV